MKTIDPGHRYELATLDGDGEPLVLQFVKRIGEGYPGNRPPAQSGTTNQEVLRALIDRTGYVNRQIPCVETEAAIGLLEAALVLFEIRAKRVKGKHLEFPTVPQVVNGACCPVCGHVGCAEHQREDLQP